MDLLWTGANQSRILPNKVSYMSKTGYKLSFNPYQG